MFLFRKQERYLRGVKKDSPSVISKMCKTIYGNQNDSENCPKIDFKKLKRWYILRFIAKYPIVNEDHMLMKIFSNGSTKNIYSTDLF